MTPIGKNKPGPKPNKVKSRKVLLTITPEEHAAWTAQAQSEGLKKLATWCTIQINKMLKK